MLKNKNATPGVLAAYNALILGLVYVVISLFWQPRWEVVLGIFIVVFLITYALFRYSLQKFIYRKIKLIYKIIYQTKATPREDYFNKHVLPQKSLEEVSKDVERWATEKRDEVAMLERNEKYRKEFLYNLSHELKTPVFAIQGYMHTLLEGALEDEKVNRRFLENAVKNIDRLSSLITDLDEITEIESGELRLDKQSFIIQDETKEVFQVLTPKAQAKQITFAIKKGCEAPLKVYADKNKIHRVLLNLVDNAIKYGKMGGHVTASFYDLDGKQILTEISDDGGGMSKDHLNRVFERFYRTDKGRDRNVGGSGLGLAIVKHLIEAHDQTIHVRSMPKVGSTFGFTLPKGH